VAFRLYMTPMEGTGVYPDGLRPKYKDEGLLGVANIGFGSQRVFMVWADLAPATEATILAHADVFAFPVDLSPQIGGAAASMASTIETLYLLPTHWLTGADTYLQAARTLLAMGFFFQRLQFYLNFAVPIDGSSNKTLNTQFNQLSVEAQNAIRSTAGDLGYDAAFIQNNTQVRALVKNFADQWGNRPIDLSGVTI